MSNQIQFKYEEGSDVEADICLPDAPALASPSTARARSRNQRLPASKTTQTLILFRSREPTSKKHRIKHLSDDRDDPAPFDSTHRRPDLSRVDSLVPSALAVPSIGQFNQLPIKCTAVVQRSVQYYTEVYARFVLQRPQLAGHGTDWGLLDQLVPFTLSDPMVLSATMALMELIHNMARSDGSGMTKSVMRNATSAITQLQQKLASPTECMGDNVVLAILNLVALEFHESRYAGRGRLNIHMQALSRIVELRGGVDNLGFDGYLRYTVLAYKALWEEATRKPSNRGPEIKVEHPLHPYSPELCLKISQLPDGFHECMLRRQLCSAAIDFIHLLHTSKVDGKIPMATLRPSSTQCVYIIRANGLPTFERLVMLGMMAFIIHSDDTKTMYRVLKPFMQVQAQSLLSSGKELVAQNEYQRKPLIWAACLFLATTQWGSWTSRLGNKVMGNVARDMSWSKRIETCESLLWEDSWSEECALKVKGQFGAHSDDPKRTQVWLDRLQS